MRYLIISFFVLFNIYSYAGVLANKSRIIFDSNQEPQTLLIANTNEYPIVVQTWVDNGNGSPLSVVPVIVTPSTFRLEPKQTQVLKLYNLNEQDIKSELVYWLNLYEIPPKDTNIVNSHIPKVDLAMNTQHKIFIRPSHLGSFPSDIEKYLTFIITQEDGQSILQVKNSSNFHISFTEIYLSSKKNKDCINSVKHEMDMMLKPNQTKDYTLEDNISKNNFNVVTYLLIDDSGGIIKKSNMTQ